MGIQVKVELNHRSSIQGARWCTPKGWEPDNQIEGSEFTEGSWWDESEETAGIVCFVAGAEGAVIEVDLSDLRVASTGNCRVIGEVEFGEEVVEIAPGFFEAKDGTVIAG